MRTGGTTFAKGKRMRVLTSALVLCLLCVIGQGQEEKYLDLKHMKVGDVGKVPPCVVKDNEQIIYKIIKIDGTHAMFVKKVRTFQTPQKGTATQESQTFGIFGMPTADYKTGQAIGIDLFVFEVVAEIAFDKRLPFNKTKILKLKFGE